MLQGLTKLDDDRESVLPKSSSESTRGQLTASQHTDLGHKGSHTSEPVHQISTTTATDSTGLLLYLQTTVSFMSHFSPTCQLFSALTLLLSATGCALCVKSLPQYIRV